MGISSAASSWAPSRALGTMTVCGLLIAACASEAPDRRPPAWAGPPTWAPAAPAPPRAESFRPASPRQPSSAVLVLPGTAAPQWVPLALVDGVAVMEGDIVLGPTSQLFQRYGVGSSHAGAGEVKGAMGVSNPGYLWPRGEIPYELHPSITGSTVSDIQWAIATANGTELEFIPRRPTDTDYVIFQDIGEGCNSHAGRIGGPQSINVSSCWAGRGSILHEMMHAAGFFHEQSRTDRDAFVTIVWTEIDPAYHHAFERRDGVGRDIGAYDYGSIMHYSSTAFSRTGNPTIVTKVPNAAIGQREGLSSLDRAAITQLYAGTGAIPGSTLPGIPGLPIPGLPIPAIPGLPTSGLPPASGQFPWDMLPGGTTPSGGTTPAPPALPVPIPPPSAWPSAVPSFPLPIPEPPPPPPK